MSQHLHGNNAEEQYLLAGDIGPYVPSELLIEILDYDKINFE
jgi:hypothetical protein